MSPEMGRAEDVAKKIRVELEMRGLHKEPLGIDIVEPPILFALQKEGITVVDGQQLMSDARVIKTQDEISLLNTSAMMVDAAYDELYRAMKPGMRENEAVGLVEQGAVRPGLGIRGSASTPFPASAAIRIRTCFPIACCAPAIPSTTTFCIPTWAIAPATTAPSRSATRRTRWSTPTSAAATTSMPPSS